MWLPAPSYTAQITNLSFCVGSALAQANAIMTGWYMGAGKYEICDKQTKKSAAIGAVLAMGTEFLFAVSAPVLISFFTQDKSMVELVQKLMFIDIALEAGRVTNLVYGNALKTSGDAVFPVILGAVFMFLCAAGGTYLLGIQLHLAVVGAYIGLTADECCRAVGMLLRWRSMEEKRIDRRLMEVIREYYKTVYRLAFAQVDILLLFVAYHSIAHFL